MNGEVNTSAGFVIKREAIGLTRADVATGIGVSESVVREWEGSSKQMPPAAAWEWLIEQVETFENAVDSAIGAISATAPKGSEVHLGYYRSQAEYDVFGHGDGPYTMANAITREVVACLGDLYSFVIEFPEEAHLSLDAAKRPAK